jgi:hypothetical protein
MKRIVPAWLLQLVWFLAGIFATGALWYFLSRDDTLSATLSFIGAAVLTVVAIQLHRLNDKDARFRTRREKLAQFMKEAESLLKKCDENPLPIQEHNEWVARVEVYLNDEVDSSYATRFGNFSGITFYGDGSQRSSFKNSLQGRSKRLHEFISEFSE